MAHAVRAYLHHLSRFFNDVCVRINNIYACCGDQLAWRFIPPSQLPNNSLPNFVLTPLDGSGVGEMVGEGKVKTKKSLCLAKQFSLLVLLLQFHSVLDNPRLSDAVARMRQGIAPKVGFRQSMICAVEQECGYMQDRVSVQCSKGSAGLYWR